ncbi:hypothetical protein [Streptomyces justiciae]|uniref:hypothetical protein n=1 Tax=Streptomyces justiciae TaxID=2780140 RepID=UPI002118CF7B|nr:hypothetical protein [Streptomyces justiciae]MCW8377825.1 hypothetical protein [Streptomyces justiciae]
MRGGTALVDDFSELRSRGQGYLEVDLPGGTYPYLTLSFRADHAVVHLFTDDETVSLLVGDDSVPWDETVEVPIMNELAIFTGHFVMAVDHAWGVAQSFVRTGSFTGLGEWVEL